MTKYINADEMAANESEAYMKAQLQVDSLTKKINEVVHIKIQQLIADTEPADVQPVVHCKDCKYLIPSKEGKDDICKKLSSEKYLFCIQGKDFYCKCGLKKHNGK